VPVLRSYFQALDGGEEEEEEEEDEIEEVCV